VKVFGVNQGSSNDSGGRDDDRRCFCHARRAQPSRARNLLERFSQIRDTWQPCKVLYPLGEVLLLVVCGTMAACDDDDIVLWGNRHLPLLRGLQEYHYGISCADWLRVVMNRIEPALFSACFLSFVTEPLPDAVGQIAIGGKTSRGKTSRGGHDRGSSQAALHQVSAYATTHRLVLGQRAVADKSNQITAIPLLLAELAASGALGGSLVSIDAMGCQSQIAEKIVDLGGDYLLATKDNQRTAHAEIELYFDKAPHDEVEVPAEVEKAHGRIETRRHLVSRRIDWMSGKRRYPGEPRFKGLRTIAMIETSIERDGGVRTERAATSHRVS
jgi:predicted transposase YbfD/YdcC